MLYHQNKRSEALALLRKAENEIKNLKVDENKLTALVELGKIYYTWIEVCLDWYCTKLQSINILGYSAAEATLGLRATKEDVNQAANYINETKEKRAERRKKAKAEEILQKYIKYN